MFLREGNSLFSLFKCVRNKKMKNTCFLCFTIATRLCDREKVGRSKKRGGEIKYVLLNKRNYLWCRANIYHCRGCGSWAPNSQLSYFMHNYMPLFSVQGSLECVSALILERAGNII